MSDDPYAAVVARLRSLVQEQLREGVEPCLLPYEQLLLLGWYERELTRLDGEVTALVGTIDRTYADRLEEEHASMAAVKKLALDATRSAGGWDARTATRLDDTEP